MTDDKKQHKENAVKWQLEGQKMKLESLKQFLNIVLLTLGFATSTIWMCDCKCSILKGCYCIAIFFMISIIIFLIVLIYAYHLLDYLKNIFFEYSEIHGKLAFTEDKDYLKTVGELYSKLDKMHDVFYRRFTNIRYVYYTGLILLIICVVVNVYASNCIN